MRRSTGLALFYFATYTLLCAAAFAQNEFPFRRIEVVLNGPSCNPVPDQIFIVINSGDGDGVQFTLDKVGKNRWAVDDTDWLPWTPGSVRWKGKHTDCLNPHGEEERTNILRFSFSRCFPTRDIEFTTDPGDVESKYVRKQESCIEAMTFTDSETAQYVGLKEQLRLKLAPQPKDQTGGLWVNKLLHLEKANAHPTLFLTLNKVSQLLAQQRLDGDGARVSLSSNALDLDVAELKKARFKSVTIKVH